jgi:hypothetical protein
MQKARLGIDIGGTFTDFVLEHGPRQLCLKLLTTPEAPERAVLDGVVQLLRAADLALDAIGMVVHGTTLATNAMIERRGAKVAFLTTEGFRDTLEMAYEHRYDQYDLLVDKPKPLVPRTLRLPVPERRQAGSAGPRKHAEWRPVAPQRPAGDSGRRRRAHRHPGRRRVWSAGGPRSGTRRPRCGAGLRGRVTGASALEQQIL